jgi:general stress protein 26
VDEQKARRLSLDLMTIAEAAFLTTINGEGFPQTRAMLNLRNTGSFPKLSGLFDQHRDDFLIYFTTNTSSSKVEQIKRNPKVSVYYCKPDDWRGLMLGGTIEIVTDPGLRETLWQEGWERYYPGGIDDPDYAILCLCPRLGRYYHSLDVAQFHLPGKSS